MSRISISVIYSLNGAERAHSTDVSSGRKKTDFSMISASGKGVTAKYTTCSFRCVEQPNISPAAETEPGRTKSRDQKEL